MDVDVTPERKATYTNMPTNAVDDWRAEVAKRIDDLEKRLKALEDAARNPG